MNHNNLTLKDIRFIDSNYTDLFKVPDGGYITITLNGGEQLIRQCAYAGECHAKIGMNFYHICEFAEKMERNGNTYEPNPAPEKVQGYLITDRMIVNNKEVVMAHNPNAPDPYATWIKHVGYPDYEIGHYWCSKDTARTDYFRRIDSEQTGRPYNHAKLHNEHRGAETR